ncbi:alcohol acetyltransferase [Myxozyma melibiosi]|uniref:Alcohol acetyltransferase n=1 Tax=Myxozyma melibiosi TaxID=54550 RepID=A0ABR1F078_9ASCO
MAEAGLDITPSRPLSFLEQYFVNRCLLDFYRSVVVWVQYEHEITSESLYTALTKLVLDNSALCCRISLSPDKKSQRVAMLKEIDLADLVSFEEGDESTESLERLLMHNHDKKTEYTDDSKPLWRLVVYNMRYVLFVFDHSVFDGMSGRLFVSKLSELLQNSSVPSDSTVPSTVVSVPADMTPPPRFEELTKMDPPLFYVLKALSAEFAPKWLFPKKDPRNASVYAPMFHPVADYKVRLRTFSTEESEKLLAMTRKHNTTITALLASTLCTALNQTIEGSRDLEVRIPVNGRRFIEKSTDIPDPSGLIGPYIGQFRCIVDRSTGFSWESVKKFGDDLKNGTTIETIYAPAMVKYLGGKIQEWLLKKVGTERDSDVEISNIGAASFPDGVVACGFSQPHGFTNPPAEINAAAVKGGRLTLTFVSADSVLGEGKSELIWSRFQEMVESIIGLQA